MKSEGSRMKSSYSSAFMYSPSTYWYIAFSGRPLPGHLKAFHPSVCMAGAG
jgi:hypothetical protein